MAGSTLNLTICQGKTFEHRFYIGTGTKVYRPITAATKAAPVVITATAHGLLDDQPYAITGAQGMTEINSPVDRNGNTIPRLAIKVDDDQLELNDLNGTCLDDYTGCGTVEYDAPKDLTNYEAAMEIRETEDSASAEISLTSNPVAGITIDTTKSIITIEMTATQTSDLSIGSGFYDIELTDTSTGKVFALPRGTVTVVKEITKV